ncbi:hypothetical protein JNJ66_02600 [Candidatus Saccharibacteria bacterium]|nr:hypothetical protein [Candidatus Saccharibacteria bacterium]
MQQDASNILVINPAGGNEPIIRGARIGLAINKKCKLQDMRPLTIVIPITDERQRGVLADELLGLTGTERIVLDEGAGGILRTVLKSQGDFVRHVHVLHDEYAMIQAALNARYGRTARHRFTVTDLTGQARSLDPRHIIGTLDIGGRIAIDAHRRDFAFPVLTSELLRAAREAGLSAAGVDEAMLQRVEDRLRGTDNEYHYRFLPLVHSLAGLAVTKTADRPMTAKFDELTAQPPQTLAGEVTYTPPLKSIAPLQEYEGVEAEGIYAMLSGTDSGTAETLAATLRAATDAGLAVYTNPWATQADGMVRVTPKAISDPRISAVVGRAGWGTGWQLLNTGKTWLVIPLQDGDDPEIYFNHQTISRLGIGMIIDPANFGAAELTHAIQTYGPRVRELRSLTSMHFGTSDGNELVARMLTDSYKADGVLT